VRFDESFPAEETDLWSDKQNSALGYFMWLRCRLCCEGKMPMTGNHLRLLGLMFDYLGAIEYWSDEDTGHWQENEEALKASSLGAVLAAIKEFRSVLKKNVGMMAPMDDETLDMMEERGQEALEEILPKESSTVGKQRDVDGALLFLIYPLEIVPASSELARTIVKNVTAKLMGDIGIRRFNGDCYWCKDYMPSKAETTRHVVKAGQEAQWCVFDPILSAIYGKFYAEARDFEDLRLQQFHLGRSLAHVTGEDSQHGPWSCPEGYYLCHDRWIATEAPPSVWTQACLDLALNQLHESLAQSSQEVKSEFHKFDLKGGGGIAVQDLVSVLLKLNPELAGEDLEPFLEKYVADGKISFEDLVDELYCGAVCKPVEARWNLKGSPLLQEGMDTEEVCEVERILTEALGELDGDFGGEYYPLQTSQSYMFKPGGMTKAEKDELEECGYHFSAQQAAGRGIFTNKAKDMGVLVNNRAHLELIVKPHQGDSQSAPRRLKTFEKVFGDILTAQGYSLVAA